MRRAVGSGVVAICAALAFAAPGLAAPAVTVSPTSQSPTLKVTVNGTGFGTPEAADVYFDTVDNALTTTDGRWNDCARDSDGAGECGPGDALGDRDRPAQ